MENNLETAYFGAGCFWCQEALFEHIKGVESVISGFAGGNKPNPTYEMVCGGNTGHAEVVKVNYDPNIIKYEELLEIFFYVHNPTTKDRQGNDVGRQYRSIILYINESQKALAQKIIKELDKKKAFKDPIVTEVVPLENFYEAEDYHQDYYKKNPEKSYCQAVISPELDELKNNFEKYFKD